MSTWIILGLAGLGIISAIIAFLKTPRNQRYRFSTPQIPIEERLATYPKSAEAVIIKADKKRFCLKVYLPFFIICGILLIFNYWSKHYFSPGTECAVTFRSYVSFIMVFYVIPGSTLIFSVFIARIGLKILKTGYFPLLDSVVFKDTIAKKGMISKVIGISHLLYLLFSLGIVFLCIYLNNQINVDAYLRQTSFKLKSTCFNSI
jgi:hypothetical protein